VKAIRFDAPGQLTLVDRPEPEPGPGEAIIQVEACGLCGTDIHTFHGNFPAPFPFYPGHEFAGTAVATGEGVDPGVIGRRFAVHPLLPCGQCDSCRSGRINFCRALSIYGGNLPGGFAERTAVRASSLHELPEGLSAEAAAFAEPLGCVLHGLGRIGVEPGDRVLLFGAGSIGLLILQAVRAQGAASVEVVDLLPQKLEIAAGLGGKPARVGEIPASRQFDLAIDATGAPSVVERLSGYVRDGGRILYFGVCPPDAQIPISPFEIFRRELTIAGCFSLTAELDPALRLLASGTIQTERLISARRPLQELGVALTEHDLGGQAIKTLILPR
jgi:2-desacetyl-2-hydroxyethyl bacteriochlorophyllide A dehydrogenase